MPGSWQERYVDRFYRSQPGWTDGTSEFHALCRRVIPHGEPILEIGAGASNPTSRFLCGLGDLHGLDPSEEIRDNDSLESASVLSGPRFPFDAARFSACVSNYVLEHIEDPVAHLREVKRVLRPGGVYVFRTPNRLHYVSAVAASTPHWFHELMANRLRNLPADTHDPYPTWYRFNTARAIQRLTRECGLHVQQLQMIEKEPSYGMMARPMFLAFMAYERLVNATGLLAFLRANILGVISAPESC